MGLLDGIQSYSRDFYRTRPLPDSVNAPDPTASPGEVQSIDRDIGQSVENIETLGEDALLGAAPDSWPTPDPDPNDENHIPWDLVALLAVAAVGLWLLRPILEIGANLSEA